MTQRRFPFVPSDPLSFWTRIHPNPQHGFFLGAAGLAVNETLYLSAGEPAQVWTPTISRDVLEAVEQSIQKTKLSTDLPRWVGVLDFEEGRYFDPGLARLKPAPSTLASTTAFGEYLSVVKIDLKRGETFIMSKNKNEERRLATLLAAYRAEQRDWNASPRSSAAFTRPSAAHFERMVRSAKEAIRRGDIYQANLSLRFTAPSRHDPLSFYRALCRRNPSPYACLIKQPHSWIASCSPELLLSVSGKKLVTKPIAGTRPRGKNAAEDRRRRGQLLLSPKERAEHVMLVDLERNDLGRVARWGKVRIAKLFDIETYSHVMHIVSDVRAELASGRSAVDALRAVFPGGTITGCPKIKSVEIIQQLERLARGPFYGSAGYFAGNGDAAFNILIRTALFQEGLVMIQAGAGIVADSHPAREYREVIAKASALLEVASS